MEGIKELRRLDKDLSGSRRLSRACNATDYDDDEVES